MLRPLFFLLIALIAGIIAGSIFAVSLLLIIIVLHFNSFSSFCNHHKKMVNCRISF